MKLEKNISIEKCVLISFYLIINSLNLVAAESRFQCLTVFEISLMCCRASNSTLFNAGKEREFRRKIVLVGCSLSANDGKLSNDDPGVVVGDECAL